MKKIYIASTAALLAGLLAGWFAGRMQSRGNKVLATGTYSAAFGDHTLAQGTSQFVIGQYNAPQGNSSSLADTDALFIIGNGADSLHLSNALAVLQNGNVGIATTTPAYKLDVVGDINFTGNLYKNGMPADSWSTSGSDTVLSSGKVGVGTTTPAYALDVRGAIGNGTSGGNINFDDSNGGVSLLTGSGKPLTLAGNITADDKSFWIKSGMAYFQSMADSGGNKSFDPSDRKLYDQNGNLAFQYDGKGGAPAGLPFSNAIYGADKNSPAIFYGAAPDNNISVWNKDSKNYVSLGYREDAHRGFLSSSNGQVGIETPAGTATLILDGSNSDIHIANSIIGNNGFKNSLLIDDPESGDGRTKLTLYGPWGGTKGSSFHFYNPVDGATIQIEPSDAGHRQVTIAGVKSAITYFGSYGDNEGNGADVGIFTRAEGGAKIDDERIRIRANTGNVGIGTTAPVYKLDVAGDINFTGDLYKNGKLVSSPGKATAGAVVATGSAQLVLIPQQGDILMGDFNAGPKPQ